MLFILSAVKEFYILAVVIFASHDNKVIKAYGYAIVFLQ